MTIAQTIIFCKIDDDDSIYFYDGKHPPFSLSVRYMRKHIDMSVQVIHAKFYYPFLQEPDCYFMFIIRMRDFELLQQHKFRWLDEWKK